MAGERYVPRQQFVDLADGVVCDAFEHMVEIELRVEAVELGGSEQRVDGGGTFSACVRSREEEVLASACDDAQRAFGGVVVDLQLAVAGIASEPGSAREGVTDRRRRVGLARELREYCLQPERYYRAEVLLWRVVQKLRPTELHLPFQHARELDWGRLPATQHIQGVPMPLQRGRTCSNRNEQQ